MSDAGEQKDVVVQELTMEECVHINVEDKYKSVNDVPQDLAFDVNVMKMEQQIAKTGLSDESRDVEGKEET